MCKYRVSFEQTFKRPSFVTWSESYDDYIISSNYPCLNEIKEFEMYKSKWIGYQNGVESYQKSLTIVEELLSEYKKLYFYLLDRLGDGT